MRIVFEDGVCDDVDAEAIGNDRVRLRATPLHSSTVAKLGDIIKVVAEGALWRFERIDEASSLVTLDLDLTQELAESDELPGILHAIETAGGAWEKAFGGMLLLHVPQALLAEIEARLSAAQNSHRGGAS